MPSFKVTPEVITKISNMFGIPEKSVKNLYDMYQNKISKTMKWHYLAHIIRTMEEILRNLPNNEMFRIVCSPVDKDSKNIGIASSRYYKGRFFAIYYHPNTDEKQLRIMLAHELGHLFIVELFNNSSGFNLNEKTEIEPASTIMGIFTILDKNDFYHNRLIPFMHKSTVEVLNDFLLLHNRNNDIYNSS